MLRSTLGTDTWIHTNVRVSVCVYVFAYVCVYVCVCVLCVCISVYVCLNCEGTVVVYVCVYGRGEGGWYASGGQRMKTAICVMMYNHLIVHTYHCAF